MPDVLKVLVLIPILIGGGIAILVLSYLLVPILIVCTVFLIAYALVKVLQEIEADEKKRKEN